MPTLLINAAVSIAIMLAAVNVPASWLDLSKYFAHPNFSGTFTTLSGGNTLSTFPTTYNANLVLTPNLTTANTFTTGLQSFSTQASFSGLTWFGSTNQSNFSATGVLTLGSALLTASGGTGSTTLSLNQVLLGNGTGNIGVVAGYGSSGQFLTSTGVATAPTWQTAAIDQTAAYNWTGTYFGVKNLLASSTAANPITLNTLTYNTPSIRAASSTVLKEDGAGGLTWEKESWQLLNSTTTLLAFRSATSTFAAATHLKIVIFIAGGSGADNRLVNFNNDNGANYSFRMFTDGVKDGEGSGSLGAFIGTGYGVAGTTSPSWITMDIYNTSATRKFITWKQTTQASAVQIPQTTIGSAIWNNTSAQITSVNVRTDTTGTFNAGTQINVYGSSN